MVRAWRMQKPFVPLRSATEPSPTLTLLPSCLAERCAAHQGFAGVRPAIRVRLALVVVQQPPTQTLYEIRHAPEVPKSQHLPGQHAEEQLHLIQPRAMHRREVEDHAVAGVAQKRPPLRGI